MGRGKGRVRRSSAIAHCDDGSGEEEKLPVKRRGRPTKTHKEEEEIEKTDQNNGIEHEDLSDSRNKRKKPSSQTEEGSESVKDENELTKPVGFRHIGSRRKNKPQRAAEVGISLCEVCSWVVLRS